MASTGIESTVQGLQLDDNSQTDAGIRKLYLEPESFNTENALELLSSASSKNSSVLRERVNEDVEKTITLLKKVQSAKFLSGLLDHSCVEKYVRLLKLNVKSSSACEEERATIFNIINSFITVIKPKFPEVKPLISVILPFIDSSDSVFLTVIMSTTVYKEQSYAFFEEQLEMLTLDENIPASFKLLSLLFNTMPHLAPKMFRMDSVQGLLLKLNAQSSIKNIKEALNLLSIACIDGELRTFIVEKYLGILVIALKYSNDEVQTLAGLVVLKTWNMDALASKDIKIDDLVAIFLNNLNEYSIEGLTYISLRKAVRIRLRKDEEFLFDLFELLNSSSETTTIYGVITICANLSTIEEKSEYSELKKQAQKNLEEEQSEEDNHEIEAFKEDLIERKVVDKLSKHINKSINIVDQITKLLYNLTRAKTSHPEILKQGGIHLLLRAIGMGEKLESRPQGLRALSSLLVTSDPSLVFGSKDSPKTAFNYLFHSLLEETSTATDLNLAIVALTNLAVINIGTLSPTQWEIIDQFLLDENTIIRRSTIELVSNLMQHKENMVELFNFQKASAKKRFELIVEYTQLEDVKSQSAALSAISFGVVVPFIAEEVVKSENILNYLIMIIKEQVSEVGLVERALFCLYYIVFYLDQSESNGTIQQLRSNEDLKLGIQQIVRTIKDREIVEMSLEVASNVKFSK